MIDELQRRVDLSRSIAGSALAIADSKAAAVSLLVGAIAHITNAMAADRSQACDLLASVGRQMVDMANRLGHSDEARKDAAS